MRKPPKKKANRRSRSVGSKAAEPQSAAAKARAVKADAETRVQPASAPAVAAVIENDQPPPRKLKRIGKMLSHLWRGISAIGVIAGLVGFVIAMWPRMQATTSVVDEGNGYAQSFTIINNGFGSLYDFRINLGFCDIDTVKGDLAFINNCNNPDHVPFIRVDDPNWHAESLARDEPFTITLTDELNAVTDKYRTTHPHVIISWKTISQLKAANIVLAANFQPWGLPCWSWTRGWLCQKLFRFVAEEQPSGRVVWRSVPLSWRKSAPVN